MNEVEEKIPLSLEKDRIQLPARQIPSFRTEAAIEKGVERNILLKTWGGLGDQICAEPTIRYAIKYFKNCKVSLASEKIELFSHLDLADIFDLKKHHPIWEKYFIFETICSPEHLTWEFFSHCLTNCVDFPSLCAFRMQLPTEDREIILRPAAPSFIDQKWLGPESVYVHPGRHWPSKTFPKDWWDSVLMDLVSAGRVPIIIGADTDDNRGTVDVNTYGCIDLRNKLSITDSIWLLQRANVLLTNDSAPLHMAASGDAWVGFVATCKHPDYIKHWRHGEFGWREKNLGLGGIWELVDACPNKDQRITVDQVEEDQLRKWLPEPSSVVAWVKDRVTS